MARWAEDPTLRLHLGFWEEFLNCNSIPILLKKARGFPIVSVILSPLHLGRERAPRRNAGGKRANCLSSGIR
jgi:hypothetical protein